MSSPRPQLPIDAGLDVAFADRLAHYETYNKHHYRPNTYLHKWWGRRCGSTFRVILKGLVQDPARAGYYAPSGLEGRVILDPMMGGGTTLHEAIRLGAGVIGVDIDNIPVLQARATLTDGRLPELQAGFARFYEALQAEIGDAFRTHCPVCDEATPAWYALYGARRRCGCGEVMVVDSLVIRQEPDGGTLRLCPRCGQLDDGRGHARLLLQRGQVDPPQAIGQQVAQLGGGVDGHLQGQPRLAAAARAHQRQRPGLPGLQETQQAIQRRVAADERRRWRGQIVAAAGEGDWGRFVEGWQGGGGQGRRGDGQRLPLAGEGDEALALGGGDLQHVGQQLGKLARRPAFVRLQLAHGDGRTSGARGQLALRQPQEAPPAS